LDFFGPNSFFSGEKFEKVGQKVDFFSKKWSKNLKDLKKDLKDLKDLPRLKAQVFETKDTELFEEIFEYRTPLFDFEKDRRAVLFHTHPGCRDPLYRGACCDPKGSMAFLQNHFRCPPTTYVGSSKNLNDLKDPPCT